MWQFFFRKYGRRFVSDVFFFDFRHRPSPCRRIVNDHGHRPADSWQLAWGGNSQLALFAGRLQLLESFRLAH